MVPVEDTVKRLLEEQGRTQIWVINRMNEINPRLNMEKSKFSALINGKRKMSGDELIAFCQALEVTPDEFTKNNEVSKPRMPEKREG